LKLVIAHILEDRMHLSLAFIDSPEQILLVLVIALLIFGPGRLPDIGKSLGRAIREFKNASSELQETIEREVKDLHQAGPQQPRATSSLPPGGLPSPTITRGSDAALPPAESPVPPPIEPN
jgi:sec-independent protein translocase protein TatA